MSAIPDRPPHRRSAVRRLAALVPLALIALAAATIVTTGLHREFSFATLVRHRAAIDGFVAQHQAAAFAGFIALYAGVVALSIPGAFVLTISGGLIFGAIAGAIGAFIGATTGAAVIFLIARTALGGWLVKRAGPFAERLADGFRRNAFSYLLFLRLAPVFPFWLVNIAPALFDVRFASFVAATAIGIIPLTFAFALFGAGLDSAVATQAAAYEACRSAGRAGCRIDFDLRAALTPELIAGVTVLGLVALMPPLVKRWKAARELDRP